MNSADPKPEPRILELLQRSPRGLTAREISHALGGQATYEITKILLDLQERGLVRRKNGVRWQYRGSVKIKKPHGPPGARGPFETPSAGITGGP